MGVATMYAKTHVRTLLTKNIGLNNDTHTNVHGKSVLMCLIPILVGFIYDDIICSKTPFNGLAPINEVKRF